MYIFCLLTNLFWVKQIRRRRTLKVGWIFVFYGSFKTLQLILIRLCQVTKPPCKSFQKKISYVCDMIYLDANFYFFRQVDPDSLDQLSRQDGLGNFRQVHTWYHFSTRKLNIFCSMLHTFCVVLEQSYSILNKTT